MSAQTFAESENRAEYTFLRTALLMVLPGITDTVLKFPVHPRSTANYLGLVKIALIFLSGGGYKPTLDAQMSLSHLDIAKLYVSSANWPIKREEPPPLVPLCR